MLFPNYNHFSQYFHFGNSSILLNVLIDFTQYNEQIYYISILYSKQYI